MGTNKWMYHAAYGILVLGAVLALIFSEKPLSATVVNLALFSFNMAAVIFVMPTILNFMARMKEKNDRAEADIMLQLKEIKARIMILSNTTAKTSQSLPLKNALEGTALSTELKAEDLTEDAVEEAPAPMPTTQTSTSAYSQAALRSVQNAAPIPTTHSANAQPSQPRSMSSSVSSADNIFSNPRVAVIQKPAVPSASTPTALQQTSLFSPIAAETPGSPAPAAVAAADITLIVKIHVEEDDVLCLRGEGAGLNWQEGMPMNYMGEDQWRWVAKGMTQPITCRIYLNDEISAFGDDIVLTPGQTHEASPSFPKVDA